MTCILVLMLLLSLGVHALHSNHMGEVSWLDNDLHETTHGALYSIRVEVFSKDLSMLQPKILLHHTDQFTVQLVHIYLYMWPIKFNGTYSQGSVYKAAALLVGVI